MLIPVSDIKVENRIRKDFGNLQELADSIAAIGLLQPIGITEDSVLIFGERRLRAVRDILGWPEIEAREVNVEAIILGEFHENVMRKDFTISERVAIGEALESYLGNRQGQRTDIELPENFPEVEQGKETREIVAARAGFGNNATYRQAKEVISKADPMLIEAMDRGQIAISKASQLVEQPVEFQQSVAWKVMNGEAKTATEAIRQIKHEERPSIPEATGKYRVLYADPPWDYGNKNLQQYGHASHHYPTMTIEEICELDIKSLSDDDAVLFLWTTSPFLEDSFKVINAWGFQYKTSFVWDKVKHNFGHYNSVRHEFLLICTRGSCIPDHNELFDSVITMERGEHSEKPEHFRMLIDTLYTHGKRIELFARKEAIGWDTWGNEHVANAG